MDLQKFSGGSWPLIFRRIFRLRTLLLAGTTLVLFKAFVMFPAEHVDYVFSSGVNWFLVVICGSLVTLAPALVVLRKLPRRVIGICLVLAFLGLRIGLEPLSAIDREFFALERAAQQNDESSIIKRMAQIADEVDSARYYGIVARIYSSEAGLEVSNPAKGLEYALKAYSKGSCAITADALACAYMANGQKDKALSFGNLHPVVEHRATYPALFENGKLCPRYGQRSLASEPAQDVSRIQ